MNVRVWLALVLGGALSVVLTPAVEVAAEVESSESISVEGIVSTFEDLALGSRLTTQSSGVTDPAVRRQALSIGVGSTSMHQCVVTDEGAIKCWGLNTYGPLGLEGVSDVGGSLYDMGNNFSTVDLGNDVRASAVSLGNSFTCAMLGTGDVKCWGYNEFGQLGSGDTDSRGFGSGEMGDNLPVVDLGSDRTAVAISSGYSHTCAILDDGSVRCWGSNTSGELGLGDTDNRGDGSGEMGDDLPVVDLGSGRTAVAISAGVSHTCAILDDGSVRCWGSNTFGELGLGDRNRRGDNPGEMGDDLPVVDLGSDSTAVAISAGFFHTCAILDDGSVKCWGSNRYGMLGLGDTDNRGDGSGEMGDDLPVTDVGSGRTAVAISAGAYHTCAILDNSSVKCWGRNNSGQLGLGDANNRGDGSGEMGDALNEVDLGAERAVAIGGSRNTPCAVTEGGVVKCWGEEDNGTLGQAGATSGSIGDGPGELGANLLPIDLGHPRINKISAGDGNYCALYDMGEVRCWGANGYGQLGVGTSVDTDDDHRVSDAVDLGDDLYIDDIELGAYHACAKFDDGRVKCWGRNNFGQLGIGDTDDRGDAANEMGDNLPFVDLGTGRTARSLSLGEFHTCALLDDFSAKCWGRNNSGQLGQGDTSTRGGGPGEMGDALISINFGVGRSARSLGTGDSHSCAILDDNSLSCWGENGYGQLAQSTSTAGDIVDRSTPVTVSLGLSFTPNQVAGGVDSTCVVSTAGDVKCWGRNAYGLVGDGSMDHYGDDANETLDLLSAIDLDSQTSEISVGDFHACAIITDNETKCWGLNTSGQLGQNDSDNRGDNSGEMGSSLTRIVIGNRAKINQIALAEGSTCAVLSETQGVACWGYFGQGQTGSGESVILGDDALEMRLVTTPIATRHRLGSVQTRPAAPSWSLVASLEGGARLAWARPDDGGSDITSYSIEMNVNGGGWTTLVNEIDSSQTLYVAEGLASGLPHVFRAAATNRIGTSPNSVWTREIIPSGVAHAPSDVVAVLAGDAAELTWSAPTNTGGLPITGYVIQLSNDGIVWSSVVENTGSSATVRQLDSSQLSPTSYFRVAALNDLGSSEYSSASNALTLPTDGSGGQAGESGAFVALTPKRLLDTRSGDMVGELDGSGSAYELQVTGAGGVPGSGVSAVALNVTAVSTETNDFGGFVTVYPCGTRPDASNLNFTSGMTIPNSVIAPVSSSGKVCFYVYGKTHLLADVSGYFPG